MPDSRYVSFMYSYPNLIPLPAERVRHIAAMVEPYSFERIYGAWWDRAVRRDGKAAVTRSAERYLRAIGSGAREAISCPRDQQHEIERTER